jgi:hypothetical protein
MRKLFVISFLFLSVSCQKEIPPKKEKKCNIDYPEKGAFGLNLLSVTNNEYKDVTGDYISTSLTAILDSGASLRVEFYTQPLENPAGPDTLLPEEKPYSWYGMPMGQDNSGWSYTIFDNVNHKQVFTTTRDSSTVDMQVYLASRGSAIIKIFENGSSDFARGKLIKW